MGRNGTGLADASPADDMADTCGTLAKAAAVLKENDAKSVLALVTHGILSGSAIETINKSCLTHLVVTNTVPLGDKINQVRRRIYGCGSLLSS